VRLRHRHEIGGVEELADRDLVLNRPAPRLARRAGQHRLFFVGEAHHLPSGRRPCSACFYKENTGGRGTPTSIDRCSCERRKIRSRSAKPLQLRVFPPKTAAFTAAEHRES